METYDKSLVQLEFEKDVSIDERALDVEWVRQSGLDLKYGNLVVDWEFKVKALKLDIARMEAKLHYEVQQAPLELCGKDKPSIKDIEAYSMRDKRLARLQNRLFTAEKTLAYLKVVRDDISYTRKEALKNLVTLFVNSYFAGPEVPRDLSAILAAVEEDKGKTVNKAAKRAMKKKETK